jgi:hypothetical protein
MRAGAAFLRSPSGTATVIEVVPSVVGRSPRSRCVHHPIFRRAADLDLDLIERRTLGQIRELVCGPNLHP